jgi:hypothetical protein
MPFEGGTVALTEQVWLDRLLTVLDPGWHYIVVTRPDGKRMALGSSCPLAEFLAEMAEMGPDH